MTAAAYSAYNPPKIAVLASGRGSNFEAILKALAEERLDAEIVAVISDRPEALVLDKAKSAGIRSFTILAEGPASGKSMEQRRAEHDARIIEALAPFGPTFLVMAGYMRVVTPVLIETFRSPRGYSRVVNVHPSLLPAFPGVDSYAKAHAYGCKLAGVTVHLVEEQVDSGPICAQESFSIATCASASEVEQAGLAVEHLLYPATLQWVLPERFEVEERVLSGPKGPLRRLCVRPS